MQKICKTFLKLNNHDKLVVFEKKKNPETTLKQSQSFNIKPSNSFFFYAVDPQKLTEIAILTWPLQVKFWKLNKDFDWINILNSPCE